MSRPFSELTKDWNRERLVRSKWEAEQLALEEEARQDKLYVNFEADLLELVKTTALGSQRILVELDELRAQNAELMRRVVTLEHLLRQRELQPV